MNEKRMEEERTGEMERLYHIPKVRRLFIRVK